MKKENLMDTLSRLKAALQEPDDCMVDEQCDSCMDYHSFCDGCCAVCSVDCDDRQACGKEGD